LAGAADLVRCKSQSPFFCPSETNRELKPWRLRFAAGLDNPIGDALGQSRFVMLLAIR
jgi:hypothetical protein